ncbi:MAG TPA: deoxynucleoside kinase [Candidatus Limnocylindrales bacterium]|jgi:thymidylate kinase|nr:deoxynucleoside kinase [Candidatus Limnocylindrales bacterium]
MNLDLEDFRRALGSLTLPRFAARKPGPPLVVAVEGPNGAGKTTLCQTLARELSAPYCLGTDEAWFTESFKVRMIRDAEWFASAMFFLSGCFEQMRLLRQRSEPLIIMDRSIWSTLAVHAAQNSDHLQALLAMLRPVAHLIHIPQLTIVLEASFETCRARIAKKSGPDRALDELTARAGFHGREQAFYNWLLGQAPNLVFLNVDEADPQEVVRKTTALLRKQQC